MSTPQDGHNSVIWAGKRLTASDELQLRRTIALLRRLGEDDGYLERFLPENDHRWTPNELETGASSGPWLQVGASL